MTLVNIVDNRKNRYQWKAVYGVIEPTENDNSLEGADKSEDNPYGGGIVEFSYGPKALNDLIEWGQNYKHGKGEFTLYLHSDDPSPFGPIVETV